MRYCGAASPSSPSSPSSSLSSASLRFSSPPSCGAWERSTSALCSSFFPPHPSASSCYPASASRAVSSSSSSSSSSCSFWRASSSPCPRRYGDGEEGLSSGWARHAIKIDRSKKSDPREGEVQCDEDLEVCPAECVREVRSRAELDFIVGHAARRGALVVVDFYRTACGSCKYIEQGFAKLCRLEGDKQLPVIFLKHNVMDEYEEMSEIADDFKIRAVPLFHFYLDGKLVDKFSTRDKSRLLDTIERHTGVCMETAMAAADAAAAAAADAAAGGADVDAK